MSYIGIDIGLKVAGWAIVDEDANLVDFGTWKFGPGMSIVQRLRDIAWEAVTLFRECPSCHVGIEMPWVGANKQTAIKLAKAWGAVCGAVENFDTIVVEIYPTTAKKALTGNAKATKEEMREAARVQFGIDDQTASADISDAIGVALATRVQVLMKKLLREAK